MTLNPALQPLPAPASEHDAERRQCCWSPQALRGVAAAATAVPFVASLAPSERARAMGAASRWTSRTSHRAASRPWSGAASRCGSCVARRTCSPVCQPSTANWPTRPRRTEPAARLCDKSAPVHQARCVCRASASAPIWVARPPPSRRAAATRVWAATGRAGFSVLATAPPSIWPGRVFKNKPAPTNLEVPPPQVPVRRQAADRRGRR